MGFQFPWDFPLSCTPLLSTNDLKVATCEELQSASQYSIAAGDAGLTDDVHKLATVSYSDTDTACLLYKVGEAQKDHVCELYS